MSITLDYVSTESVASPVAQQIVSSAKSLVESYDWWAEPIFFSQRADQRLVGSTRVRLGGYGDVEVSQEEEELMVCKDTTFLVSKLAEWSARYKVSWSLTELDAPVGTIVNGKLSSRLSAYLSSVCSNLKLPLSQAPGVLKKHEARKE